MKTIHKWTNEQKLKAFKLYRRHNIQAVMQEFGVNAGIAYYLMEKGREIREQRLSMDNNLKAGKGNLKYDGKSYLYERQGAIDNAEEWVTMNKTRGEVYNTLKNKEESTMPTLTVGILIGMAIAALSFATYADGVSRSLGMLN